MPVHPNRRSALHRPLARGAALLVVGLAAVAPAAAQTAGPGGINFWNSPVDGNWFDSLAWNGVLPS